LQNPDAKKFNLAHAKGLEMVIHQWWAIANLRIKILKLLVKHWNYHLCSPKVAFSLNILGHRPWLSTEGNSAFY
jgi:hypothetical protein